MRRAVLACLVTAMAAGGAGYLLHRRLSPQRPPLEVIRIDRPLPRSEHLNTDDPGALALAADGRVLVAAVRNGASTALLLQYLDKFEAGTIPGTVGASAPFLSPDGATIGFVAQDGSLRSVSSSGDAPTPLLAARVHTRGATSGPGGQFIVGQRDGGLLFTTAAGSGTALTLPANSERAHAWPHWIPGVDAAVFTIEYAAARPSAIGIVRLASPGSYDVLGPGQRAWFIDARHIVVARQDGLWAVELRGGKAGAESRIAADVARATDGTPIAAAGGGHLVYMPAASDEALIGASVEQGARFQYLVQDRRSFSQPRISPDGQSVAVTEAADAQGFSLAVYDAATGTRTTNIAVATPAPPRWTADSRWILFPQPAGGAWQLSWLSRTPREGVGQVVTESMTGDQPRGSAVRLRTPGISAEWQLSTLTANGGCQRLIEMGTGQWPDAHERPAPDASEVVLASGGRWLFFRQGSALLRREVIAGARLGVPMVVLAGGLVDGPCGNANYDVTPDGTRVIAVYRDPVVPPSRLRFVLNFAAELR